MSTAISIAPRLAVSRLRSRGGGAILDVLAVVAFAVSTWLALTVAGGTHMFIQRSDAYASINSGAPMADIAEMEVLFALIACALLVVPILGLGGAAARLGARGRSRRLASLRLIGMTGSDVVSMSLVETMVQAAAGVVVGTVGYLVSLPAWSAIGFQGQRIEASEMLVPWWLGLAVIAAVLVLAALSTVIGLQRVRISPLGVAHNTNPAALRVWRVIAVVVALVAFLVVMPRLDLFASSITGFLLIAAMMFAVIGGVNLLGPFVLQMVATPFARTGKASRLIAMRRIIDDPRGAWRNVSAVALITLIATFVAMMPAESAIGADPADEWAMAQVTAVADIRTGVAITLLIGLLLAAVSVLMTQASGVFDRASESVALDRMGTPRSLFSATRRAEVLMPLLVTMVVAVTVGLLLSSPFFIGYAEFGLGIELEGLVVLGCVAVLGIGLTLLASESVRPLQARVLGEQRRRND